jgi:spore coat polysaccharide biosynthesis predicted glycosyltransferase SpsG
MFYFKAEANSKIGGGHLHRCLAIAKKCRGLNMHAEFIFSDSSPDFVKKVSDEGFKYHIIKESQWNSIEIYKKIIPEHSLIVFDTDDPKYFGRELNEDFNRNGIKTACYTITDQYEIWSDIVINPNIIAFTHEYKTKPGAITLLGPEYMIIRDEFIGTIPNPKNTDKKKNILITFGNADVSSLTLYVLPQLQGLEEDINKCIIIIGPLNRDSKKIKEILASLDNIQIDLYENVSNMIPVYKEADIAITSAGMGMWEMSLFEIKQLVIASSPREVSYVDYMDKLGYIKKIGTYDQLPDKSECQSIIRQAIHYNSLEFKLEEFRELLNPNGTELLIKRMKEVLP